MTRAANPDLPARILEEAERVVIAEGYQAINMRRLASKVGVTATAIYHYFESKEAILRRLQIRAAEKLNARIRAINGSLPPHEFLHELGRQYLTFAQRNPNQYRLLFEAAFDEHVEPGARTGVKPGARTNGRAGTQADGPAEDHAVLYYTYLAARGALEKMAAGGHQGTRGGKPKDASGKPPFPDPRHGAMMGWMMLHGFCSLMLSGRLPPAEGMTRESLQELFMRYYTQGPQG